MTYAPRNVSIRAAIEDINKTFFLPSIQREFVWDVFRVEKLFDSIMAEYPIGSFLFWQVREEKKDDWTVYKFLTDFDQDAPHNVEANLDEIRRDIDLVLDGQQRLTALNIGLRGSYRHLRFRWKTEQLYLNLLKPIDKNEENPAELQYQFKFRESSKPDSPDRSDTELWYRVGRILKFYDLGPAITDIMADIEQLDPQKQENARTLIGRLHGKIHSVPLISYDEERSEDYDRIVEIFIRANTAGKPLEYSDILLSLATAKWKGLNARDEIHNFTDEINKIEPGYNFGKDFVLKAAMYLTEGLPIKYKVSNFTQKNLELIQKNWPNIKEVIEKTVRLVSKFGFTAKNITATMALLPVAYYLLKLNKKNFVDSSASNDSQNKNIIRKWLILVLLKNSFGGSSDTTLTSLRTELASMSDYTSFPFDQLNKKLGIEASFDETHIETLFKTNYGTKHCYLILSLLLYPDMALKDQHYEEDHIYPKAKFTKAEIKDEIKIGEYLKYRDSVLNLELLTREENREKSSMEFEKWVSTRNPVFLETHSIPELDNYEFLNFLDFIEERKEMFRSRLKTI